jgi:outer membrane biosynthesis protein TonB
MITAAVGAVRAPILKCGAGFAGAGRVKVGVTVAPDGSITNVDVREAPDEWLGRCVATRIKAARLAATQQGGTFTYPFVF